MTRDEAERVIRKMSGMFARALSDEALETWHEELEQLAFSAAYAAARQVARENTKMPTPAEFRGLCGVHERRQRAYDEQPEHRCGYCDGTGWQETIPGTPPTVRPCRMCRPNAPIPKATTWSA